MAHRGLLLAILLVGLAWLTIVGIQKAGWCCVQDKREASFVDSGELKARMKEERTLHVHVVPHTHDDVGWLKTVDQYYNGWNNTIQVVSVREILTSVVEALEENPSRTFTYVEQKFFALWWKEQSDTVRERVRRLVQDTRQLTFVNGGWCMHDEAATHFIGMIDQTTLGHDFLRDEFGYIPTVGWQLDPFGHSATQASLMTHKMGFDALYFGRIDYQDLELRHATRECEGLWNPVGNASVFWGLTGSYEGNYGAPGGYCFDVNCGPGRKSLIDKNRTTLIRMVEDFLSYVRIQADRTKGDHVMLTMGSDFQYQRASVNFANLDLLIGTIRNGQEDGSIDVPFLFGPHYDKIDIFYSSPEAYTKSKFHETRKRTNCKASNLQERATSESRKLLEAQMNTSIEWSVKTDDFFPYSDCPNCFWTGYFTSRPSLKRFERAASSFLLAARQIESVLISDDKRKPNIFMNEKKTSAMYHLEDALGVIQHHDGVSGTSKQHVAYDYAKTLQGGMDAVIPSVVEKLKQILLGEDNARDFWKDLTYCQLLNETQCDTSVEATTMNKDLYVVVYNSLGSSRSVIVDLPVGSKGEYIVEDLAENAVQRVDTVSLQFDVPASTATTKEIYVLSFRADSLPEAGAKTFRIRKDSNERLPPQMAQSQTNELKEFSNGYFSVTVDPKTGDILRIGNQSVDNLSTWGYYTSFDSSMDAMHNGDDHNSGAYIFRPSTPNQKLIPVSPANATIVHTSLGTEIQTTYEESWIQTKTRILKNVPYLEVEYQVGPIPIDDGRGKEVVSRYNAGVENKGIFYTDSNGRQFLQRRRNYRPTWDLSVYEPVAGNYYPINTAIFIQDESIRANATQKSTFAVVTDRTQGGGSILDGTVEIMVHRRTLADDHRGVGEAINETDVGIKPYPPYGDATRIGNGLVIRGKHRILVGQTECKKKSSKDNEWIVEGEELPRSIMDATFAEPLIFAATAPPSQKITFRTKSFSGLRKSLPKNVMLITKKIVSIQNTTEYLVRLAHQFGESAVVDLSVLFPEQAITEVQETTLSGNRGIDQWRKERFDWSGASKTERGVDSSPKGPSEIPTSIILENMDIRTFRLKVGWPGAHT